MPKGPDAFRTISEAADEVGVPQHVLRFWETRFAFIKPLKRAGGRRFYRPQDIEVLRGVRVLLHEQGYTIKGVQKLHRDKGVRRLVGAAGGDLTGLDLTEPESRDAAEAAGAPGFGGAAPGDATRRRLETALHELEEAKARLDALLAATPDNS